MLFFGFSVQLFVRFIDEHGFIAMAMTSVLFKRLYFSSGLIMCLNDLTFFHHSHSILYSFFSDFDYKNDDNGDNDVTKRDLFEAVLRHSLWVYFGMRSHQNKGCTELASCYLPRFFFNGVCLLYLCVIIKFPLFSRVFRRIFHECLQDLVFSRFVFNSKFLFWFRDSYFKLFLVSVSLFFLSWYFDNVIFGCVLVLDFHFIP